MSCDSYYGIGDKHQVCQDYALHGTLDKDMEYVIVSDGCSSAEHSEIGAQILCHAAKYQIALCYQTGLFRECSLHTLSSVLGNSILKRIHEIKMSYPISSHALEATLFIAVRVLSETYVFGWGDGVIIEHFRRGDKEYRRACNIDFTGNAPFYLVYDIEDYARDMKKKGYVNPEVIYTHYIKYDDGQFESDTKKYEYSKSYKEVYGLEDKMHLVSLTVCTDGVCSFQDADKKSIELMTLIPEIMGYKSTAGEFVKKRMFFLKRKARKNNWSHSDDIGCGTIFI